MTSRSSNESSLRATEVGFKDHNHWWIFKEAGYTADIDN
jgi:hypothetical protein